MHELLGEDGRHRSHHRDPQRAREGPRRDSIETGCTHQRRSQETERNPHARSIFPEELALITMMDPASTATRSEALQRITNRKDCPSLLECESAVTQDYFKRICGTRGYVRCHHYAKRMGELKVPMTWLQHQAIKEAVKNAEDQQPQSHTVVQ